MDLTDDEEKRLKALLPKSKDAHLTPARKQLKKKLSETRTEVASYAGEFNEEDIETIIEVLEEWRKKVGF